jgi:SPP1 family predicted phage head-tail adaptor
MADSSSSIMKQRVILQKRVLVNDAFNAPFESWEFVAGLRASVEPLVGREFFASGTGALPQKQAQIDMRIRIRYRKGLNPAEHRIVYGGVVYDLVAVIQDRERRQTQLMVTASSVQQPDGGKVNA